MLFKRFLLGSVENLAWFPVRFQDSTHTLTKAALSVRVELLVSDFVWKKGSVGEKNTWKLPY